jgi:hypothetical protein
MKTKLKYPNFKSCITVYILFIVSITISYCQPNSIILTTSYKNPTIPPEGLCNPLAGDHRIDCGCPGGDFPWNNDGYEWRPAANGVNDVQKIFGLSGLVVKEEVSSFDFPCSHPFGYRSNNPDNPYYPDWESFIIPALSDSNLLTDHNLSGVVGSEYGDAFSEGFNTLKQDCNNFTRYDISKGIMGVEFDQGLIDSVYRSQELDQTAVFGTLIVDCGHTSEYHAEIHPPLVLINARPIEKCKSLVNNEYKPRAEIYYSTTYSTVISRPFRVTQLYNDHHTFKDMVNKTVVDAGWHAWGELTLPFIGSAINYFSSDELFNLEPEITSIPDDAIISFDIFPTTKKMAPNDQLNVDYHLTCRTGVSPTFFIYEDHVSIVVVINTASYKDAIGLLGEAHKWNFLESDKFLEDNKYYIYRGGASQFLVAAGAPGIGARSFKNVTSLSYECPKPYVRELDSKILHYHKGDGYAPYDISDEQPFPIYGWIAVNWKKPVGMELGKVKVKPEKIDNLGIISIDGEWNYELVSASGEIYRGTIIIQNMNGNITGNMQFNGNKIYSISGTISGTKLQLTRDTKLNTIQIYNLTKIDINHFKGTFKNDGKYSDSGTIDISR